MPWDHRLSEVCPKGDGWAETEGIVGTAVEKKLSHGLYRVIGKTLSFTEIEMGSHWECRHMHAMMSGTFWKECLDFYQRCTCGCARELVLVCRGPDVASVKRELESG